MDCYKLKPGNYPQRTISKTQFERDTQKQPPWHNKDNSGKIRNHAVCPACENPIQILGLFEPLPNAVKPYGRHTGKAVDGFPYFNPYDYETCRYVRKGKIGNKQNKRKKLSPLTLKILITIRDGFDVIITQLEKDCGFSISYALAERMLNHYMGEGYLYVDANLQNIPWTFAYMAGSHTLFGRTIFDADMKTAICQNVPDAAFADDGKRLIKGTNGFYEIAFCFIEQTIVADTAQEQMTLSLTTRNRVPVYDKTIIFDYQTFNQRLLEAHKGAPRNTRFLEISRRIIDQAFPDLDQLVKNNE